MFSPRQVCAAIFICCCMQEFAHGHGELVHPRSRNAIDWNEVSCDENTDLCSSSAVGNGCVNHTHPTEPCFNGQASFWYSQGCFIGCSECDHASGRRQTDLCGEGKVATLPDWAHSVNLKATPNSDLDIYKHNPWRAPGNAPVANACGLAGGSFSSTDGTEAGYYVSTSHANHGQTGTSLPPTSGITWEIGGLEEVSWQVRNNHGGGYSYRLCPIEEGKELTEECFQNHPLDFEPSLSWLLFKDGTKLPYKPLIVDEGTQPKGSQWARTPIPPTLLGPICKPGPTDDPNAPHSCEANNDPSTECGCTPCPQTPGSDCSRCDNCHQPSFPPLYKNSTYPIQGISPVVGMVDTVKIPSDLKPGKYVLGWRYDCEVTAQVWSNCADVTLVVPSNITTTTDIIIRRVVPRQG